MRKSIKLLLLAVLLLSGALGAVGQVRVGAQRPELYLPLLKGKRVALLSNHTGIVGKEHTLDLLLRNGVNVTRIFAPEHGFRGTADAGEHVSGGVDAKTGIKIVSLYGAPSKRVPSTEVMSDVDVVVSDMQDVGLRFYTYYITMLDVMDAAARDGKQFVVLDRPNPNGMYVDGPVLDMSLVSGVGRLPIPVVHGMTLGELAKMIVGEKWLKQGRSLDLTVVPCENYTHSTRYVLPVPPSPNLPDMKSVYLYPSVCPFEGTVMSVGRGTDFPFSVYGHPSYSGAEFFFTPRSKPGAKSPLFMGKRCAGVDLRSKTDDEIIAAGLDLSYVIDAYRNRGMKRQQKFFSAFFDKIIGDKRIRPMIEKGSSAQEIKALWADDVRKFRKQRRPYLIYPE